MKTNQPSDSNQSQIIIQTNVVNQHLSNIWNRVLFSMELLELALRETEEFPAYDLDVIFEGLKPGVVLRAEAEKRFAAADLEDSDLLVSLQIRALKRGMNNSQIQIEDEQLWMAADFLRWLGGRTGSHSRVDDYSTGILMGIAGGITYPQMTALLPAPMGEQQRASKAEMMAAVEAWAVSAKKVDETEAKVEQSQVVIRQKHARGDLASGIQRCRDIWAGDGPRLLWLENVLVPSLRKAHGTGPNTTV